MASRSIIRRQRLGGAEEVQQQNARGSPVQVGMGIAMARKKKLVVEDPADSGPTYEQIAERAYDIYLARGETPGHDIDDWLRAEAELREELGREAAA